MSVLKLRRDMVVAEDASVADPASESERPFPLRKREPQESDIIDVEVTDAEDHDEDADADIQTHRTFGQHVRFWLNTVAIVAVLGAYPVMTVLSSDVGDRNLEGLVNRADWAAPWVGGASSLMQNHFDQLGWASDAEAWEPMARLTAKPAYQSAMASSLGDVITLAAVQAAANKNPDVDLEAAARLVKEDSTGIQLRAARDALLNHDRRLRRRDATAEFSAAQLGDQLALLNAWASVSQERLIASSAAVGGSPMDEDATRAVYAAKGRATVAYLVLDAMNWPQAPAAAKSRDAALAAWKEVAEFHPLVVLNGDADGSVFGNHPAAISYLLTRAEAATHAFAALVNGPAVAPAPVGATGSSGAAP